MKLQILLLLILIGSSFGHRHQKCNFKKSPKDNSILQRRQEDPNRNLQNSTPQKIRIKYDVSQLNTLEDPIMKEWLIKTVELTVKYFSDFIKVKQPIESPFKLEEDNCNTLYSFSNQQMAKEYEDADLVIFATYVDEQNENYVAYASGCQQDKHTGRNIVGMVNFNSHYVSPGNVYEFQNQLQTTIHELFHVIVFDSDLYKFFLSPNGQNYDLSFFSDLTIKTSNVQKWVRDYYGCQTLEGMPLENDGGSGTSGSHWEYMALQEDTMTAAGDDTLWSGVNNALLLDSGWYDVDLKYEDHVSWGRGKGCDFITSYCKSSEQFPEFCYVEDKEGISFSFHSKGSCIRTTYDETCMYMDYGKRKDVCYDPNTNKPDSPLKENFGENSRAFFSTIAPVSLDISSETRCHNYKCINDNKQIDITFGSETFQCKSDGEKLKSSSNDYKGELTCPNIKQFCEKQNECTLYCSANGYCIAGRCICLHGFNGDGCQCKEGEVQKDGTCKKCGDNCKSCNTSDPSICTECIEGYFKSGNTCVKCNSPCKTCVDNADKCLSCVSNYIYETNVCTQFKDTNCDIPLNATQCKQCVSGRGLDANGKCTLICDSSCNTCTENSEKCSSCNNGKLLFGNKCVCEDGFYLNEQQQCSKCSSFCKICSNSSSCDVCVDLYSINHLTKQCNQCPIGSFLTSGKCKLCSVNCIECSGSKDNCTVCTEDAYLFTSQGKSQCKCNKGFFLETIQDDKDQCSPCDFGCESCEDSTQCHLCFPEYKLNESLKVCDECNDGFVDDGNGNCICKEGTYLSAQNKCVLCSIPCDNCSQRNENCKAEVQKEKEEQERLEKEEKERLEKEKLEKEKLEKEKQEKEAMTSSNILLFSLYALFIFIIM